MDSQPAQEQAPEAGKRQNSFGLFLVIGVIIAIIVIGLFAYYFLIRPGSPRSTTPETIESPFEDDGNTVSYTEADGNFTFNYPEGYSRDSDSISFNAERGNDSVTVRVLETPFADYTFLNSEGTTFQFDTATNTWINDQGVTDQPRKTNATQEAYIFTNNDPFCNVEVIVIPSPSRSYIVEALNGACKGNGDTIPPFGISSDEFAATFTFPQ